jgi:AraC-like DNA-binding protein
MAVSLLDESVQGRPAPALRPYVAWYSGFRQAGVAPARHRGLPSPYLTLILTLDDPLTMAAHPDPAQEPGDFVTLLGGLHTAPALVVHQGRQSGVQVAMSPLGARQLLGLPAGEIAGVDLHADDVLGRDAREAQERLRLAADWPERFAVVDDWLLARLAASGCGSLAPEVGRAWEMVLAADGNVTVVDLAAEVGWSTRHLSARFAAEIGLGPKAAGRVVRFDRARRRLAARARRGPGELWPDSPPVRGLALADLAVECGYFDQAHLDREFRALAGCSPVAWLAEEFRNIQAGAHVGG